MDVIFVRHGEPDYSLADQRAMSQLEKDYSPLTRQAVDKVTALSEQRIFRGAQLIVSSPYTRALQTAEILNRRLGLDLYVEHDLREWRADMAGGYIPLDERDRRWKEYRHFLQFGMTADNPAYETRDMLRARAEEVLSRYQYAEKVVVVSHFNVFESLQGFQDKEGLRCANYRCFEFVPAWSSNSEAKQDTKGKKPARCWLLDR